MSRTANWLRHLGHCTKLDDSLRGVICGLDMVHDGPCVPVTAELIASILADPERYDRLATKIEVYPS